MGILKIASRKHGTHDVLYDDIDKGLVDMYTWHVHKAANSNLMYAETTVNGKKYSMHRMIMTEATAYNHVDYRRSNMRYCKFTDNIRNQKIQRNSTTGYKGVSKEKRCSRYRYNDLAIKYHGEYASINILCKKIHFF